MKKLIPSFIAIVALAFAGAGCGKDTSKDTKGGGGSASPSASGSPSASTKDTSAKKLTFVTVSDTGFGYEVQIPKGSKTLQKSEYGHTYSYPLPGGMHEYNVHITNIGMSSLKKLIRFATMMGQKKIAEQKTIPGGFLVVKAPTGVLQTVYVSKKGKTAKVTVKCSGPTKDKDLLVKICTSLKVTK